MNTYDPASYVVYVSMDRRRDSPVTLTTRGLMERRLPSGYANGSPRTRLRTARASGSIGHGAEAPGRLVRPVEDLMPGAVWTPS